MTAGHRHLRYHLTERIGERVCGPYRTPDPRPLSVRRSEIVRAHSVGAVEWAKNRKAPLGL